MIYSFKCNTCGADFDVMCKMSERDDAHSCKVCGSSDTIKMVNAPAVHDTESYANNVGRKQFQTRLNEIHKNTAGSQLDKTSDGIK